MYVVLEKKEKLSLNYPQYPSYLDFWKKLVRACAVFIPVPHPFCSSQFNYPQKTYLDLYQLKWHFIARVQHNAIKNINIGTDSSEQTVHTKFDQSLYCN